MVHFPESSDPPSTPHSRNASSDFFPSTTPAGLPPSHLTNQSFTPAGQPPRSVFGSSYNAANNTFPRSKSTPGQRNFTFPLSSPPQEEYGGHEGMDYSEADDADDGMDLDRRGMRSSVASSLRGLKRSRRGDDLDESLLSSRGGKRPPRESPFPAIAKGIASRSQPAQLSEPDNVVLDSEEILSNLDHKIRRSPTDELDYLAGDAASQVTRMISGEVETTTKEGGIGPDTSDGLTKAIYLSSLLLQTHYPHSSEKQHSNLQSQHALPPAVTAIPVQPEALPKTLLNWLKTWHNPFPPEFEDVRQCRPSPSAHDRFWDTVNVTALRGDITGAIQLLRDAGLENAGTAFEDGYEDGGYRNLPLDNANAALAQCIKTLETCPAVRYDDWDVKGPEWAVFRSRIQRTLMELKEFAEGDSADRNASPNKQSSLFGASLRSSRGAMSLSTRSRIAESKVPWAVYEALQTFYGLLLGTSEDLILCAQDWLEATILLTAWWDGNDNSDRRRKSGAREADVTPMAAYRKRLAESFATATDEPEAIFQPETTDPVHVALASIFEDNTDGMISILQGLSTPVTAAVTEIAAAGGWLPQGRPRSRGLMDEAGFSQEDLMILSHGSGGQKWPSAAVDRDEVLSQYAAMLARRETFASRDGKVEKEGWEVACAVLGRLDSTVRSQREVGQLLDRILLDTEDTVDKVLGLCNAIGLAEQGRALAERYADTLAGTVQTFGPALIYYARAHSTTKLKATLDLLTSLCLIQSSVYPTQATLDPQLHELLNNERHALVHLGKTDVKAMRLLSTHLSGYATLRKLYDLRDSAKGLAGKRAAASALVGLLESAADCIDGGLFDPHVDSVISTDCLLALFGEALPLLAQDQRIFTRQHVFALLRVVEDFAAAPSRIREGAESLLQASLERFRGGGRGSPPLGLGGKSRSDLSASSYDMLLSETSRMSRGSCDGSGEGEVRRGWDWRGGVAGIGGWEVGGREVVGCLRTALALCKTRERGEHAV